MRSLWQRGTTALLAMCALFALAITAVGVVGVLGVRSSTATANDIASDELATAVSTAQVGRQLDTAYATGEALLRATDPAQRSKLADTLYNQAIPALDAGIADLVELHASDGAVERATIDGFEGNWHRLRALLNATRSEAPASAAAEAGALATADVPLGTAIDSLLRRERADANAGREKAAQSSTRIIWVVVLTVLVALLAAAWLAWFGRRVIRRAVEPGEDQVEFADTLQLAQDEEETHRLLKRYLERSIRDSTAVVLNRNNSADRLEAVTDVPDGSALVASLKHAEPRSCLAVRSGRPHTERDEPTPLLGCPVCSGCPGSSVCTPLTVGGEVIGAVLLNRVEPYARSDEQRIRDSVSQAAPVLANLRNLAIAELRAATDSLTGLPNKRAVADTTKRMFAQASRTGTPLSLLMLDLDHFKAINDRFGHPVGDQALADVGAALRAAVRSSDFAGRNGGEEFCVLLPDTDIDGARLSAEKIRALIADIAIPGVDLAITASVGIATFPDHASSAERLERLADSALYLAKRSGRNRSEIANGSIDVARPAEPKPTTDLRTVAR
jgi:diguanylate cyclase (GGDEF)-like protein